MSTCEKCWADSATARFDGNGIEVYSRLIDSRECTPEEQAGPNATMCAACNRRVLHQHTGECMACGNEETQGVPRG